MTNASKRSRIVDPPFWEITMSVFVRRPAGIAMFAALTFAFGASVPSIARVSPKAQTVDGGVVSYDARTGQYCIADQVTGSRIAQRTCKSKDQWAAEGLTISAH
jgi:hypothetical protein